MLSLPINVAHTGHDERSQAKKQKNTTMHTKKGHRATAQKEVPVRARRRSGKLQKRKRVANRYDTLGAMMQRGWVPLPRRVERST